MDISKLLLYGFVREKNNEVKGKSDNPVKVPYELNNLFQIIYLLIKIRGTEKVRRFFPHEPKDFEPVLFALASHANDNSVPWESNYVLLIWLSLILLMPFNLKILDSEISSHFFQSTKENTTDIVRVIIDVCKLFINSTTRTTSAAGICLGRLFTRDDVK